MAKMGTRELSEPVPPQGIGAADVPVGQPVYTPAGTVMICMPTNNLSVGSIMPEGFITTTQLMPASNPRDLSSFVLIGTVR